MSARLVQDFPSALSFDGSSSKVSNLSAPVTGFLSGCWSRIIFKPVNPAFSTIYQFGDGSANRIAAMYDHNRRCVNIAWYDGSTYTHANSVPVNFGDYNEIVLSFDGSTLTAYSNGLLGSLSSGTVYSAGTNGYRVAEQSGFYFKGNVALMSINLGTITASEVKDMYISGINPYPNTIHVELGKGEPSTSTWYDTSPNTNHGTISGATLTSDVPSQRRKLVDEGVYALQSNGTGQYVDLPLTRTASGTIEIEFKCLEFFDFATIFDSDHSANGWEMWIYADGRIAARTGSTANIGLVKAPVLGKKHTAYLTWVEGGDATLYLDGYLIGSTQTTGTTTNGTHFYLFGNHAGNDNGKYIISKARFLNTALSGLQVRDLYFENKVPRDNLVAEYLFNDATGSTLTDTSGNNNHGTITGATWVPNN